MQNAKDPRITTIIFLQSVCLIVLVLGGFLLYGALHGTPTSVLSGLSSSFVTSVPISIAPMSTTVVTDATPYPFDQLGVLIASGEQWYLLYSNETMSNQVTPITFSTQSICVNQYMKSIPCTRDGGLMSSSRARISGNKMNDSVVVGVLTILP